jgi:cyclic dehypoxanthinyl futalosine synthase
MVSLNRDALIEKVFAGERISAEDALELYRWPLEDLGVLADARRNLAKAGAYDGQGSEVVTYIVDRNINYTNVCNVYCKFCAFIGPKKTTMLRALLRRLIQNSTNFRPWAVFKS